MKTSVSLSVFPAPPGMPALFSGGTEQNISRIQELGYNGVDLFVKDPASADTRRTLALLRQYGWASGQSCRRPWQERDCIWEPPKKISVRSVSAGSEKSYILRQTQVPWFPLVWSEEANREEKPWKPLRGGL